MASPIFAPEARLSDAKQFEFVVPIRWGDQDAMGHVNNTLYFRYMEQARISWFNVYGLNAGPDRDGPILAHVSCDFVRPLTYPGDVLVRQTVTRLGRSSVDMDLQLFRTDEPGQTYAKGKSVIVWMDYRTGRSAPWPEHLRALLAD